VAHLPRFELRAPLTLGGGRERVRFDLASLPRIARVPLRYEVQPVTYLGEPVTYLGEPVTVLVRVLS
jgi:hypothetical protein